VAAVAALTVLAFAGVWFTVRKPTARLLPALLLPGVALGMNHPAPGGLAVAGVMLVGCAWATLVTCCWPRTHPPAITPTPPDRGPDRPDARRAARSYAVLFAAAAGIGLALGTCSAYCMSPGRRQRRCSSCGPIRACWLAALWAGRLPPSPVWSRPGSSYVVGQLRSPWPWSRSQPGRDRDGAHQPLVRRPGRGQR
jgi:hypothetical protein